jgi:hypothetical protein
MYTCLYINVYKLYVYMFINTYTCVYTHVLIFIYVYLHTYLYSILSDRIDPLGIPSPSTGNTNFYNPLTAGISNPLKFCTTSSLHINPLCTPTASSRKAQYPMAGSIAIDEELRLKLMAIQKSRGSVSKSENCKLAMRLDDLQKELDIKNQEALLKAAEFKDTVEKKNGVCKEQQGRIHRLEKQAFALDQELLYLKAAKKNASNKVVPYMNRTALSPKVTTTPKDKTPQQHKDQSFTLSVPLSPLGLSPILASIKANSPKKINSPKKGTGSVRIDENEDVDITAQAESPVEQRIEKHYRECSHKLGTYIYTYLYIHMYIYI